MAEDIPETAQLRDHQPGEQRQKLLAELFTPHRPRLRLMVEMRLDERLQRRVDPSDVLQEAYIEASRRLDGYLEQARMPFFIWLRRITAQKLIDLQRQHFGTLARDINREVCFEQLTSPEASSGAIAARFLSKTDSPIRQALQEEVKARVQEALQKMDPIDREVLSLRHFEQLSNVEAALTLGIETSAASKRHARALRHLKALLRGFDEEATP